MDTVALIGRLLLSLGVVLGVMWLLARRLRRSGRIKNGDVIDVLARQQLSRTSSVAVVQVLDQALILGVTETNVSVIGETDLAAAQAKLEEQRKPRPAINRTAITRPTETLRTAARAMPRNGEAWRGVLETLRDLTSRTR